MQTSNIILVFFAVYYAAILEAILCVLTVRPSVCLFVLTRKKH